MSKDEKDKRKGEEERSYSGSKIPGDEDFAKWILRQWQRGEHVQRIEIIEFIPKGSMKGFGQIVDFEIFPTQREPDMEEAIDLSNRFLGSAQINCSRIHKKPMTYYARAYDKGRTPISDPVATFPIDLQPRNAHLVSQGSSGTLVDDDEATPQSLGFDILKEALKVRDTDRQREDTNLEDVVFTLVTLLREERSRSDSQLERERAWTERLHSMVRSVQMDWMSAIKDYGVLLRQELDDQPRRELTKIKADIYRESFRAGKNLLTGAIGSLMSAPAETPAPAAPQAPANGQATAAPPNGHAPAPVVTRMTQERMLIDNFFEDCKGAKIDEALFGKWEKGEDGRPVLLQEGIFKPEQFFTLMRVLGGHRPADDLDDLMPDSGKPLAITMEQLGRAQGVEGMTEGIASSLVQLVGVRKQKIAARIAAAPTPTPPAAPPTPSPEAEKENADV